MFIACGVGATSDRTNAQLLILLLVYRGYFLCDVGIAWLTLYAVISSVIVPHSGGLHPKLFLVEGLFSGLVPSLGDVGLVSLCEERLDNLPQVATSHRRNTIFPSASGAWQASAGRSPRADPSNQCF